MGITISNQEDPTIVASFPSTTASAKQYAPDPATRAAKAAIHEGSSGRALENFSLFLEVLKEVSEASDILGPMKVVCGVLLVVTKIAQNVRKNRGDLEELRERLEEQSETLQRQTMLFGACKNVKEDVSYEPLVNGLTKYAEALREIKERLTILQSKYVKSEILAQVFEAKITEEAIQSCSQMLNDAFDGYKTSIIEFTALQVMVANQQIAKLAERSDLSLLRALPCANARGNQHASCMNGTRVHIIEELESWARSAASKPVMTIIDQAGKGKSTLAYTMADKWEKEGILAGRFFFSRPTNVVSAKEVASTLARDMVECLPSIRPIMVNAAEEHLNVLQYSIDKQLRSLVFTPLAEYWKKRTAGSRKLLSVIRDEQKKRKYLLDPHGVPRAVWEPNELIMEDKALVVGAWRGWRDELEMG